MTIDAPHLLLVSEALPRPEHPLRPLFEDLATFALGIMLHRIVGVPDKQDAANILDDMRVCIGKFDRIVEGFGEYAGQHWHGIDQSLFKDQLLGALDGNGFYEIESTAERAAQELTEEMSESPGSYRARIRGE